jgi:hypothetical protein
LIFVDENVSYKVMIIRPQIAGETSVPPDRQALNIGPELQVIYQQRFASTHQYRDRYGKFLPWISFLTTSTNKKSFSIWDPAMENSSITSGATRSSPWTLIQTLKKHCVHRSISYLKTVLPLGNSGTVF